MKPRIASIFAAAALMMSLAGCGQLATTPTPAEEVAEKFKAKAIVMDDLDAYGGADGVQGGNDHADSKYYASPDFYNMKSDDQVTIIENFQTGQQTTEWSCSTTAILMSLNHFGITKYTEMDIAKLQKANTDMDVPDALPGTANNWPEPGASLDRVMDFLNACPELKVVETNFVANPTEDQLVSDEDVASLVYSPGMKGNLHKYFTSMSLYTTDNDPSSTNLVTDAKDSFFVTWLTGHLSAGRPILAHTSLWNGHWVAIIGYDNMGTPGIGDDMIIFADGYDVSDHWQDGYTYRPLEEFFYEWNDLNIAQKPYQLQPFVVVDKAE